MEGNRTPVPILRTGFSEVDGRFSPDMRWIAYASDESGRYEVYVRVFSESVGSSETGGKWLISEGGGMGPRWRKDGKELYYRTPDGKVMAVDITPGGVFQAGLPKILFQARPEPPTAWAYANLIPRWDVTADGSRFLMVVPGRDTAPTPFTVVLNWTSLLKK